MKKYKIALLGCGTVGMGVIKILYEYKAFYTDNEDAELLKNTEIKTVLVRDTGKYKNTAEKYGFKLTDDFYDIINDDEVDILIELMGGQQPAAHYMSEAINRGKHVITANKSAISPILDELQKLAATKNVLFCYEASVAGAIPIIKTIKNMFLPGQIKEIQGIVNGTTNFIISCMEKEGLSYNDSLIKAQQQGFAEADPTLDVEGYDVLYKMQILSFLAFGKQAKQENIMRQSFNDNIESEIDSAKKEGCTVRYIGSIIKCDDEVKINIQLKKIPFNHSFAMISGAENMVDIASEYSGSLQFRGLGAGSLPTASAVVGDLLSILR